MHQLEYTLHNLASPRRSHTFWGLLVVLLVCSGLIWLKHGQWLKAPNEHMLGGSPDGFKNYMTSVWHVRHDSSYVHYEGMNYPFGEHVLFTDNQPLLSAGMQWWSRNVSDLRGHTVGVINIFQVISLLFGCGVLFLLFRRLHIPVWYCGLAALGMVFLSPQFDRFDGHFALSHTWVFPLLLLLLSGYEERYSRRYQSLQIGVLVWLAAQIHFYYFGLSALFLFLYTAYQLMRDPAWRNWRARLSHLFVMVVLPFALLNIWIHWADFATDRPSDPYGFTVYIGQAEGVFLPYETFPLYHWIDTHITPIRRVNGETKAYAGAVAFFFTLWLLVSRFRLFGKSWDEAAYHRVHKRYLQGIFFAALVLLIFACGFPFAIKGMEWMVNYFGPLKQFRGLGRFTWAYYYVINLLAFYALWNWSARFQGFRGGKARWFRWVIALLPMVVLGWEAFTFQRLRTINLMPNFEQKRLAAPAPDHWLNKVDFSEYQALLPLPYYHMGSENIWWEFDFGQFIRTQTTALHTGKPDMGVNLSRTSCHQMVTSAQMMLEPGVAPAMLSELPDNRPLAILMHPSKWDEARWRYPFLIAKAKPVYEHPEMKVLSLAPDSLRAYVAEHNLSVERDRTGLPLLRQGDWQVSRPANALIYSSFDSLHTTGRIFQGKGAYTADMGDTTWLWRDPLPQGKYWLSFWMYVDQDIGMNHELKIFENSLADGHEVHFMHEGMRFYLKSIIDGWGLFEIPFEVRDPNSRLNAFLYKPLVHQTFYMDELLIRPQDNDVYRRVPNWVVRNNYWYKLDN